MGTVFRARDLTLGRDVAIKILKTNNPARKSKLLQEARAQARIDHNNVCRIYEVGEANGEPYMVMQFIDGTALHQFREDLNLSGRVAIIRDVARAVHAAHQLGIVHGDIKPSNILIRRSQDGLITPILVDFGIAREFAQDGISSGAGPGTPVYMAPELVTGLFPVSPKIDVYALGATLYELLGGRPPYEDGAPKLVLSRILTEDPLPLRHIVSGIPLELDAIAMKSLSRNPADRQTTALELAEELDHFLEALELPPQVAVPLELAPISQAPAQHFWRNILLMMAFAVAAATGAIFVERRRLGDAAQVERELVQEALSMEQLMRNAYQMPLHDVERERRQVRERLEQIKQRLDHNERIDRGVAEYAIGRGYLALADYDSARTYLERARVEGYVSDELDQALGKTLLALFEQGSRQIQSIKDDAAKQARLQELDKEYRTPALGHLRASLPLKIEQPSYAEARIAFHEGRHLQAIAFAREAFAHSPLLYDAKRIEGDAHVAIALELAANIPPDWQTLHAKQVESAAAAYEIAAEIARSEPEVLDRMCFLWMHATYTASYKGELTGKVFERAREICANAVTVDSANKHARHAQADMLVLLAFRLANSPEPGDDPTRFIHDAVRAAEGAVATGYNPASAKEMLATALRSRIMVKVEHSSEDASTDISRVIQVHEELLRDHPERTAAWNASLGHVYILRSRLERWRGVDLTPTIEQGMHVLEQSVSTPMAAGMMHQKQAMLHMERAAQLRHWKQSPRDAVSRALVAIEMGRETHPAWIGFLQIEAIVLVTQAHYEIEAGTDAHESLAAALKATEALAATLPIDVLNSDQLAEVAILEAMVAIREGQDARPAIEKARTLLEEIVKAAPWLLAYRLTFARLELLAARDAVQRKVATQAHFDAVRKALGPWLDAPRADPEGQTILKELDELTEKWRKTKN